MTMMLTKWDTPLNQGKGAPLEFIDAPKAETPQRPATKVRRKDRFAMSWNSLCITTGKNPSTWWYQVHRYGMSELEALKDRRGNQGRVVMTMADICHKVGASPAKLEYRRRRGWSFREALLGREGSR